MPGSLQICIQNAEFTQTVSARISKCRILSDWDILPHQSGGRMTRHPEIPVSLLHFQTDFGAISSFRFRCVLVVLSYDFCSMSFRLKRALQVCGVVPSITSSVSFMRLADLSTCYSLEFSRSISGTLTETSMTEFGEWFHLFCGRGTCFSSICTRKHQRISIRKNLH